MKWTSKDKHKQTNKVLGSSYPWASYFSVGYFISKLLLGNAGGGAAAQLSLFCSWCTLHVLYHYKTLFLLAHLQMTHGPYFSSRFVAYAKTHHPVMGSCNTACAQFFLFFLLLAKFVFNRNCLLRLLLNASLRRRATIARVYKESAHRE